MTARSQSQSSRRRASQRPGLMRACLHCRRVLPAAATVCADDGAASVEVAFDPLPAALTSRLRKVEPFAVGATGQLFTAVRVADNQELLLKVYAQGVGLGVAERTRCKRELRKQASIAHVQLPKVF